MSRSVLLQLARDSISEVLEMQRTIDAPALYKEHPLLEQKIATKINLYLENELRGSASTQAASRSLLEDIIYNAKKSAFEDNDFPPLSTSEYLHCEIEIVLMTQEGIMSERDPAILTEST